MIILGALLIGLALAYICFAVWVGFKVSEFVSDDMSLLGVVSYLISLCIVLAIPAQILYWIFG